MKTSPNPAGVARNRIVLAVAVLLLLPCAYSDVWASGARPEAVNDEATVVRGGTVSVLTTGADSVLANDFDNEGDPLIAVLVSDVEYGVLTFENDGTFEYQHDGSDTDRDTFHYRAFDGTGFSRRARVRIEIEDEPIEPIPPQIVGQNEVSVNEDSSREINLGDLDVVDPDSNYPADFTLEVNDGTNYTRLGAVVSPIPDFNGQIVVPVRVFDGSNFSNLFSLVVDVLPQNDAPFPVGAPEDQEANVSVPFQIALAGFFDDIDENDTLEFSASGLPVSGSLGIDPVSGVLSGTPIAVDATGAAYDVVISATDSGGLTATVGFQLIIFPEDRADLDLTATVSVNPVTVGETTQWTVSIENRGPANLEEGDLDARWATSGPMLSLTSPQSCSITANDSTNPAVRCPIDGLAAGSSTTIEIYGTQESDGDNSLIAVAVADDPVLENNSALIGAQVVAEFSEGPTQMLSLSGTDIAAGDLNGDGKYDLVVASEQTVVFFNTGNRTIATPGTSLGPASGGAVAVLLDWNGDTFKDIAVAGMAGLAGRIYLNDGNGGFPDSIDLQISGAGTITAAAAADFDNDGSAELVLSGNNGTGLVKGDGQSGFLLLALPAGPGIDASVVDINSDNFADIVLVEAGDRSVNILRNSGNGETFSVQRLQRGSVASATATDLNGDGAADLLLAKDGMDLTFPESLILYQLSDGSFSSGDTIGASPLSKLLAGDVDGDSVADIIALNEAGVHQFYRGEPSGGFALNPEQVVSAGMRRGVLIDFNNDESLDLIMAGPDASVVEIHANNGIGRLGLGDRVPPVISLNGDTTVNLAAGTPFNDPGATAVDDIDGDLTGSIVTSGSVNTTVVGTYQISYSVSDRAANTDSVQRVVIVGVNQGTGGGGGGGGAVATLTVLMLLLILGIHGLARAVDRNPKNRPPDGQCYSS